ncbi:MAG: Rrf2 family transcriptional regulator [Gemmatimonadetes bacterium]|nr:Rrf2 family transcriptional regulator [Gemmatimonadota bacterium]
MRLTRFTDNALRCLMVLGWEPDKAHTVQSIARSMSMSYEHLVKIVQRLAELGYVETVRGRHGGVKLARAPELVRIGDVVRATEESLALVECFTPGTNACPVAPACQLAGFLDDALTAFLAVLDQRTLADVLEPREQLVPLLRTTPTRLARGRG